MQEIENVLLCARKIRDLNVTPRMWITRVLPSKLFLVHRLEEAILLTTRLTNPREQNGRDPFSYFLPIKTNNNLFETEFVMRNSYSSFSLIGFEEIPFTKPSTPKP